MSSEREMQPLGNYVSLISGNTPSTVNSNYWGGSTPWISAKDMGTFWIADSEDHLTADGVSVASKLVPVGSVLILTRGMTLHKRVPICRTAKHATFNQDVKAVLPKPTVSGRFLPYLLTGNHDRLHAKVDSAGHGTGRLNTEAILSFPVWVPHLSEQDAIADIGEALDDRITLLRETNATLEAVAQALFKSWFVDFDPVRAKIEGRAPHGMDEATAALFPDALVESELGLMPRGWRVSAVEEFAERVGMGPFGSNIKVETFVDTGIPVISGQHLKQFLVEDNTFNYITQEHASRLTKSCVQAGDVIFTHAGSIGQVSLLHKDSAFASYVLSQRQFFLRCNAEEMTPEWALLYFKSPAGQHQLLANTSQVGVPSIARPVSYLRSIRMVVPPLSLNLRFASIVGVINDRVMANRKQFIALTQIRDTLLPRLITGKLRLPEALEEATQ